MEATPMVSWFALMVVAGLVVVVMAVIVVVVVALGGRGRRD